MPTITKLHVENFGCVKNVDVALTPLHAFIGPNDSGKSTLLKAIELATRARGFSSQVRADTRVDVSWGVDHGVEVHVENGELVTGESDDAHLFQAQPLSLLRLDPDAMRGSAEVILEGEPLRYANGRGAGLAAVYDALTSRNFSAFTRLREQIIAFFPTIADVGFPAADKATRTIRLRLTDGSVVAAPAISEGMLYFLAIAALPSMDVGACVLIEEPENGLHPARIADVMRVLRELSKTTQVVLATHNPLVINELEPDEVSVVTRDAVTGTKVTPIAETPKFDERSKAYQLGELWLAYSDGEMERPLLEGGPRL